MRPAEPSTRPLRGHGGEALLYGALLIVFLGSFAAGLWAFAALGRVGL